MNKNELLQELNSNIWVALKPSPIEGIGVFALRAIPKGCREMFSKPDPAESWINLSKPEVESLPPHSKWMVENYCLYDDEYYFVPAGGFKKMDLSYFLNHSGTPNIISIDDGDYFETTRDIVEGEELLIDYGTIVKN